MKLRLITALVMALLYSSNAAADGGANSVYIDQTNADQSTVSITQTGSNNSVGDPDNVSSPSFVIDGNSMNLTIIQDGMNNSIKGNFIGGDSTANIQQNGNTNSTVLNYGNFGTNGGTLGITLNGSNNNSILNIGTTRNSGNYNYGISLTGDNNDITSTINSKNTTNSFTVAGDSNTVTTTQVGANGTALSGGHNITSSIAGSNNSLTVVQDGATNPNSVTVNVTGNNTTTAITQH
jgi:hypothetical protein